MCQLIIRLRGDFIEFREDIVEGFMQSVAKSSKVEINAHESDVVVEGKQWKKIIDSRSGWKGDILLRCHKKEDVVLIFQAIDGKAIAIGSDGRVNIEVIPHATLAREARHKKAQE